jgi:hypothetical protein
MFIAVLFSFLAYLAFKWFVIISVTLKQGGPLHVNQAIWEGRTPQAVRKEWRENIICLLVGIIYAIIVAMSS